LCCERGNRPTVPGITLAQKEPDMTAYDEGDYVEWDWGNGTGHGAIQTVYTTKTTKTIKGSEITRDADRDNPAYLIEQSDGGRVLKSHSEIRKS
jgi:hypothetical protein